MESKFNFYEFNNAPYYALVITTNTYEALKTYDAAVSDIEPEEDFLPDEISEQEALVKLSKSPADEDKPGQMGMEKARELIEEYKDWINAALESQRDFESHIGELVLIDASLL